MSRRKMRATPTPSCSLSAKSDVLACDDCTMINSMKMRKTSAPSKQLSGIFQ